MRLFRRILLLLAAMLFLLPAAAEDGNLLHNGSFELLDGDGLPSGWYTQAWYNDGTVTSYSMLTEGRTGMAAVVDNLSVNDARFAQNVRVEPDTLYRLSGYVKALDVPDSGRGANLSIEGLHVYSQSVYNGTGDWELVELYGRTGPEQTSVTIFARVGGYGDDYLTQGRAAFDDLRLEKAADVPAGVRLEKWYSEPAPIALLGEPEQVTEAEKPFWPWLLVISGVYVLGAFIACRWLTAVKAESPLQEEVPVTLRGVAPGAEKLLPAMLVAAAVLRLFLALNVVGYEVDVGCFVSWGDTFLAAGPGGFYQAAGFCDYPPGYLYILGLGDWLVEHLLEVDSPYGLVHQFFNGSEALAQSVRGDVVMISFLHKLVPILCDLAAAVLVYHIARQEKLERRTSVMAAMLLAFNPAIVINGAAWCQVDSVLCLMLMLVAYLAIRGHWAAVLPVYVAAVLVKPQALMLGFLGLAAIIMALLCDKPSRNAAGKLIFPKTWRQMGLGLVLSLATALVIILPAAIGQGGLAWLFELYGKTLSSYPYATVNTANLYYLFGGNWNSILYPASQTVTAILMVLSAAWCAVTFIRRRDRRLTLLEPALCIVLVLGVAALALGIMGSDGLVLSTGNPWYVYELRDGMSIPEGTLHQTVDKFIREYIPGIEDTWAGVISPTALIVSGVLLLAAAAAMAMLLRMRLKGNVQQRVCLGLVEPALMLLFTLAFAFMLVFDTTWMSLGTVAMALAFAVVLPIFVRGGKMRMLPLCGAVLFILLYVFGVKMHERYLFPALFLLGMACVLQRDRRLVWLLTGLSATMFINEGIVLDNSIRLGAGSGHLMPDTHSLACALGVINVALACWSAWLCQRLCAEDAPARGLKGDPRPILPVRTMSEEPCTPLNYRDTHTVRWSWRDAVAIGVVTAIYAVVTFTTLGATKAPQNAYVMADENSQVVFDLGAQHDDFTFLYNCQVSYRDFTIETSDDGVTWEPGRLHWAQMAEGECFRWKYLTPYYMKGTKREFYGASDSNGVVHLYGRYVRITAQRQYRYDETYKSISMQAQEPLIFNEVIFRNAAGEAIDAKIVSVYEPRGESWTSQELRMQIMEAEAKRMEAQSAALYASGDGNLLELTAAQGLSAMYANEAQGVALLEAEATPLPRETGMADAIGLLMPPDAPSAAALLDEQDTLDGEPGWWNSTYFDEIYHARTGFEHATGQDAYEWTHPPLGKVIMSWFIQLFGMTPFGWRFAGALCGVLMLPAMYALAKQLTRRSTMGFAAMLLMAVDCMHFTQTRIATIDSYPVLFIILSYFFMLRFIQRDIVVTPMKKLLPDLALCGFFMGCGVASKWIGIYAGVGLAVLYFWACLRALSVGMASARRLRTDQQLTDEERELLRSRDLPAWGRVIRLCLWCLLFFVAVPLAIYLGSYVVHYQAREYDGIMAWLKEIWNTQINILNYHGTPGLGMDHPYYSPWYEWFTMQKPMYYASPSFTPVGWRYAIYCFGNPLVWYGGLAGIVYLAIRWLRNHRYRVPGSGHAWQVPACTWDVAPAFVLIGLAAQLLPWVLVPRGTYIYHYFASVPFLILGAVMALDRLIHHYREVGVVMTLVYLALALALFIFLFPYASGVLSPEWWMDAIRSYPWTDGWLAPIMEAVPLVPNVW